MLNHLHHKNTNTDEIHALRQSATQALPAVRAAHQRRRRRVECRAHQPNPILFICFTRSSSSSSSLVTRL